MECIEGKFGQDKSQELVSALAIVDSFADERRDLQAVFDRLVKSSPASLEALIYLIWSAFISRIKYHIKPSSLAAAVRLPSVLCNFFTINPCVRRLWRIGDTFSETGEIASKSRRQIRFVNDCTEPSTTACSMTLANSGRYPANHRLSSLPELSQYGQ